MRDRLGWDVVFVVEDDELRRASDREHYRMAHTLRRTLISLDDDFLDPQRFPVEDGSGAIILSAPNERGLIQLLNRLHRAFFAAGRRGQANATALPLRGQKIHVHPDWTHPSLKTERPARRRRSKRPRRPSGKTGPAS